MLKRSKLFLTTMQGGEMRHLFGVVSSAAFEVQSWGVGVTPIWIGGVQDTCGRLCRASRSLSLPVLRVGNKWDRNLFVEFGMCWLDYEDSSLTKGTSFRDGGSAKPRD